MHLIRLRAEYIRSEYIQGEVPLHDSLDAVGVGGGEHAGVFALHEPPHLLVGLYLGVAEECHGGSAQQGAVLNIGCCHSFKITRSKNSKRILDPTSKFKNTQVFKYLSI